MIVQMSQTRRFDGDQVMVIGQRRWQSFDYDWGTDCL